MSGPNFHWEKEQRAVVSEAQSRGEIVRSKAKEGLDVSCSHCELPIKLHFKQSWHLAYDDSLIDPRGSEQPIG
jgi:hypothetical protein